MQQAASSRLKLSVSDTMAIAQKLYEAGKITCMRLDAVMTAAFGEGAVPAEPPRYESKEGSHEAHEAIRPTDPAAGAEGIDPEHAPLYDLIRRRLLASQMAPARIRRTTWKLSAPGPSGQPVRLEANGRVVVDPGFHRVLPPASLADEPPAVPDLAAGTVWAPGSAAPEVSSSWTKPPPRYTETSLHRDVAGGRVGVGSPLDLCEHAQDAGRAPLRAARRPSVRRNAAGAAGLRAVAAAFPKVTDVGFRAELEKQLDEVASGRAGMHPLLDGFYGKLRGELSDAEIDRALVPPKPAVVDRRCPGCGGPTAVLLERGQSGASVPYGVRTRRSWSGRPGRRGGRPRRRSLPEKAASEQAAADQRLQSRCGSCGGAQQRWKVVGGYVHLCAAWPACGGVAFEAGRGAGVRRAGPPLQAGGPAALTSIV